MNENVVYVDFRQNKVMSQREQYLNILAAELDELDFQDFMEAVENVEAYQKLDSDLQDLVDGFWACPN